MRSPEDSVSSTRQVNTTPASQSSTHSDPFPNYVPITQFVLRVLGVYLVIEGMSGVFGNGLDLFSFWRANRERGLPRVSLFDSAAFAWFAASLVYLLAGAYLAVSGRWVIEKVFLPAANDEDETSETIRLPMQKREPVLLEPKESSLHRSA